MESAKIVVARKRQRGWNTKGIGGGGGQPPRVGGRREYEGVDGWEHWSGVKLLVWLPWWGVVYIDLRLARESGENYICERTEREERHVQAGGGLGKAGASDCSDKSALALEFDYLDIIDARRESFDGD